jgi:hypothetical protein
LQTSVRWAATCDPVSRRLHPPCRNLNRRLVSFCDGKVTFRWRDSAHKNKKRLMSLAVDEFLLPLFFYLLGSTTEPATATNQESPAGKTSVWNCHLCGGLMVGSRRARTLAAVIFQLAAQGHSRLTQRVRRRIAVHFLQLLPLSFRLNGPDASIRRRSWRGTSGRSQVSVASFRRV